MPVGLARQEKLSKQIPPGGHFMGKSWMVISRQNRLEAGFKSLPQISLNGTA
jgi:hypothetical protein